MPSLGDTRRYAWRQPGAPRSLRHPLVPLPCSSTPAGPTRQALRRRRRGPRSVHNEGAHDHYSSGAQSHGFSTRCLRFGRCLATRDARRASRGWPLCGAGWVARRIPLKGFRECFLRLVLLSQAFLAQRHSNVSNWRLHQGGASRLVILSCVTNLPERKSDVRKPQKNRGFLIPVVLTALCFRGLQSP